MQQLRELGLHTIWGDIVRYGAYDNKKSLKSSFRLWNRNIGRNRGEPFFQAFDAGHLCSR
jgi:hypothetical protein